MKSDRSLFLAAFSVNWLDPTAYVLTDVNSLLITGEQLIRRSFNFSLGQFNGEHLNETLADFEYRNYHVEIFKIREDKCPRTWDEASFESVRQYVAEINDGYLPYVGIFNNKIKDWFENVTQLYIQGGYGEKKFGSIVAEHYGIRYESSAPMQEERLNEKAATTNEFRELTSQDTKIMKSIFISHASKDADIATHFVKYYLRDGLEVQMDQVFYTSHAATGIGVGEDFRDTIKQALKDAKVVILLISENFKASQYCIAEMGAAWVLDKVMIPICIPPFDRVHSGQLLGPLQYIDVNNRLGLTSLRDQLVKKHGVGKIVENSVHWQEALDDFVGKAEKKIAELEAGKK